jgi:hypothetical protein
MTGHHQHHDSGATGRTPEDRREEHTGKRDQDAEHAEDGRRVVDESVPVAEGFTSPGRGADDEPVEPRQSKDYA